MSGRWLRALFVALALAVPSSARAQDTAVRFEILSVNDSTFTFNASHVGWIAKGQNGIAVDPRRRDVLVARFRILGVRAGMAEALILGQTQKVSTDHVALVREPTPHWYTSKSFWSGLAAGIAGGFLIGRAL